MRTRPRPLSGKGSKQGSDDDGEDLVGVAGVGGQGAEPAALLLEAVDRTLLRGGVQADVGHLASSPRSQTPVILPRHQFFAPALEAEAAGTFLAATPSPRPMLIIQ